MGERTMTLLERFRWRHTGAANLGPVWRVELPSQVPVENWPDESEPAMEEQQLYGDPSSLTDGAVGTVYAFHVCEEDEREQ